MSTFSLKKIKELDPSFVSYLRDTTNTLLEYDNLLLGLQDLNKNHKAKRIVFVNSKCSDKGYVCVNCKNDEFDKILEQLESIIKLHEFRVNASKDMIDSYR